MLKLVQAFVKLIQELVIVFILNMIEEDYHPEQKNNQMGFGIPTWLFDLRNLCHDPLLTLSSANVCPNVLSNSTALLYHEFPVCISGDLVNR